MLLAAWLSAGTALSTPGPCRAGHPRRTPVVEAVEKVRPSVVNISSEKKAASNSRWPFSPEENQRPKVSGMGTGVVLDGRGYILTNYHVVEKVHGILVHLADGSSYPARVVDQDEVMDLAMIKIDAGRPLPPVALGSSSDLMLGEDVIAIGNAFGYEHTVSAGIISALGRNVTLSDEQVYRNLIQTDACINPGNSGGPLINIDGELIGINVAVRQGAQGIGFALPIDDVKRVAQEMISTRRRTATWHGLVAGETRNGPERSVVLTEVPPGSPAEAAGLRPGDRVLKIGDLAVSTPLDIERALLDLRPGQKAPVVVRRGDGQEQTANVELQPLPRAVAASATAAAPVPGDAVDQVWRRLGLKAVPVASEYVSGVNPKLRGGLFVQAVSPGSIADRALIQKGDILVGMNLGKLYWETIRPTDILYILRQMEAARATPLHYFIVRRNEVYQGPLLTAEGVAVRR